MIDILSGYAQIGPVNQAKKAKSKAASVQSVVISKSG